MFRMAAVVPVLQWGHALAGMDIILKPIQPELLIDASMGPCPFRHGYEVQMAFAYDTVSASMGPCPFRHGYLCFVLYDSGDHNASMGPCPFRHGYPKSDMSPASRSSGFNGAMPFQTWI